MIPGSKNISLIKQALNTLGNQWRLLAVIAGVALLSACENDLKAIQKISAQEVSKPINRTTGVDVIMSEDAVVKVHLTAPYCSNISTKIIRKCLTASKWWSTIR